MSDNLTEKLRDLFSRFVDRRRDEMRRALARELDDPLAEISLDRVDPLRLEVIGQADLLRRHRLRLDHELRFLRAADRGDDPARLLGIDGAVDLGADRLGLAGKSLDELGHVVDRFGLAQREVRAQAVPVDLAHACVAALLQLRERAAERGAQSVGPEGAIKASFEFGLGCGQSGPQPPPLDRSAVEASPPRNARRTTRAAPVPCARRVTRTIPKLTS